MYSFTEEVDDVSMHDMVALQSATINQLQQQVDSFKNDSAALKAASEVQQADLAEMKQKIGFHSQTNSYCLLCIYSSLLISCLSCSCLQAILTV